ncbi:fatty acid desaturase family protein [Puia dinghuensis]|uniref:Fatty acid desaturase domain-containing protein n=1 Tax=Puia dinghuensis TaxID=1792502 RepID=A0A8J2UED7_9BACT|nr:fatty acid desaturase [Puia dinghuensis]GGB06062.1 hypothetical protein GCM10011511_31840 [Puia dinghuensis]
MSLLHDQRLRTVRWRDLSRLTFTEKVIENGITLPWLIASLTLAWFHLYLLAAPCSFLFFLTGLRVVHNGFHHTLGVSKTATWFTLFLNSMLMMTAMHAVKYNHLRHHKYCLQEEDVEGNCARMKPLVAVLYGPIFIYRLHAVALRDGGKAIRQGIRIELAAMVLFALAAFFFRLRFLEYHILAMLTGELFSGFFAVWTVHHDCDEHVFARTLSPRWKNFFTYNMFYHLEHHLFPGVPTIKLPELSTRIREKLPDLQVKEVF